MVPAVLTPPKTGKNEINFKMRPNEQWDMLRLLPALRRDAPARTALWPRLHACFNFVWLGPARTVTGLHYDEPANWFVQLRGVKELILLPPASSALLPHNGKYDFGCGARGAGRRGAEGGRQWRQRA